MNLPTIVLECWARFGENKAMRMLFGDEVIGFSMREDLKRLCDDFDNKKKACTVWPLEDVYVLYNIVHIALAISPHDMVL